MNIVEALAWLDGRLDHEASSSGIAAGRIEGLSLASMRELMALLGDPQLDVPVIHITGTNGKGTVAAMVTALLVSHGLSVGTYTSPHLERLNERISRDGRPIGDEDLAEVLSGIAAVEALLEVQPSWFEVMTAAAFRWFAEAPVDVAVIEVGLLGRYDATNVAEAQVAVVTSIGGDHTDFAPGWEVAVASEKAGIIGADSTAVLGDVAPELVPVFRAEGPAELVLLGTDVVVESDQLALGGHLVDVRGRRGIYTEVFVPLHGRHQLDNAAVALAAVEAFFDRALPDDAVREAFAGLELPGRFEVVRHHPLVVLDGAHNPDALAQVARTLEDEFAPVGSRLVVLGQLAGRDPDAAVAAIAGMRPDLVICTSLEGERGVSGQVLAGACARAGLTHEVIADPQAAVARALAVAAEEDTVVVTGSFRLLAPARRALR
jgi:dihydrofolate synthase/folylpolyglutamate synthase